MVTTGELQAEELSQLGSEGYERVVRLAQAVFGTPVAALNFLGRDKQYVMSAVGFPTGAMPRSQSICQFTVQEDRLLEFTDLREDDRTKNLDVVTGPLKARYYAGVPLRSTSGQPVGTLCIVDLVPRELGASERVMLEDLGSLVESELAVQEEMLKAGDVQRSLLPTEDPHVPGWEVAGRVVQYREAGGDFFDWNVIDNPEDPDQFQVVLADVMGKGLAASLLAAEIRAVLRGHSRYTNVGGTLGRTTKTAKGDLEANGRFVTMWIGRIDPPTGRLDWIDVGHGLAALVSPGKPTKRLYMEYAPLGVPIDQSWRHRTDYMEPGDTLIIISDGVFDVFGSVDALMDKIPELMAQAPTCQEMVDTIVTYASTHGTADDCTALVLRRKV